MRMRTPVGRKRSQTWKQNGQAVGVSGLQLPLAISDLVSLLKNPPEDGVSTLPPVKPKAGDISLQK